MENKNKSKVEANKEEKKIKLFDSAFKLFTKKGIKDTSVQEITDDAGLAKGTFYLYFNDKYELQDKLVIRKSRQLFYQALKKLDNENIEKFDEKVIFIVDYIISYLNKNRLLLKFISKNLSWGLYNEKVTKIVDDNALGVKELFLKNVQDNDIKLKNPDVTLFMIIELVSSTCFTSIMNQEPLPIDEYKPYLYSAIKKILNE